MLVILNSQKLSLRVRSIGIAFVFAVGEGCEKPNAKSAKHFCAKVLIPRPHLVVVLYPPFINTSSVI